MQIYEILDAEGGVINTIQADDAFVEEHFAGRYHLIGSASPAEDVRPTMIITQVVADEEHAADLQLRGLDDVTCTVGSTLQVTVELRADDGNIIPLSDSFRLPLRARDGREKVLLATMADGVIQITAPLRESGVWMVSESSINEALPPAQRMRFGGFTVFVVEA